MSLLINFIPDQALLTSMILINVHSDKYIFSTKKVVFFANVREGKELIYLADDITMNHLFIPNRMSLHEA